MEGFSVRKRSSVRPLLVVAALIVVVLVAFRITQSSEPAPTQSPGSVSAIDACQLPSSDVKSGGTYKWQMVVRLDSPQESAIVFVSDLDILQCEAWRGSDGTFYGSFMGVGTFQPRSGTALTYDIGTGPSTTYPTEMVIGQVPSGTGSVDVVTTDGEHHSAAVGDGWYLAWATTTGQEDEVVEIDARDSAGKVIASLADPSGLQAGVSAAPAST
jgi:hypothetical protein